MLQTAFEDRGKDGVSPSFVFAGYMGTSTGGDARPQFASKPQGFSMSIQIDDPTEAERVFRDLGEGGVVQMSIGETFWGRRFGILVDKFGTPWMVNCEKPAS